MGVPLRPDPQAMRDQAIASLVRAAAAIGLAALDGTARAPEHARRRFGEDRGLELALRAAVSPTALAGTPALAHVAYAYLEALVPASAGADLFNRAIGLNFNGAASISVPGIALPVAGFVGEGQPIPVVHHVRRRDADAVQAGGDHQRDRRDAQESERRDTAPPVARRGDRAGAR
jgi:hypothetical protein